MGKMVVRERMVDAAEMGVTARRPAKMYSIAAEDRAMAATVAMAGQVGLAAPAVGEEMAGI
jgi:hypothetical protein